jgi:hypothetical protein
VCSFRHLRPQAEFHNTWIIPSEEERSERERMKIIPIIIRIINPIIIPIIVANKFTWQPAAIHQVSGCVFSRPIFMLA